MPFLIRQQQVATLESVSIAQFERQLCGLLRQLIPRTQEVSSEELHVFVAKQLSRAREFGFVTEQDFASYITVAIMLGDDFATRFEPPRVVLNSPDIKPDEKRCWLLTWGYEIFRHSAEKLGVGAKVKPLCL